MTSSKLKGGVAAVAISMFFAGQFFSGQAYAAQGLDLGALFAPAQPVQQANVPPDLQVARPRNA